MFLVHICNCIVFVIIIYSEYVKRIDPGLPFYLWTLNEAFRDIQPNFDAPGRNDAADDDDDDHHHRNDGDDNDGDHIYPARQVQRLHQQRRCRREDPAIFVAGRALLPARYAPPMRRPVAELPNVNVVLP